MIVYTLQTLKAFNNKGRFITVPQGTFLSLPHIKAKLLIELGLARPIELPDLDNSLYCLHDYERGQCKFRTLH